MKYLKFLLQRRIVHMFVTVLFVASKSWSTFTNSAKRVKWNLRQSLGESVFLPGPNNTLRKVWAASAAFVIFGLLSGSLVFIATPQSASAAAACVPSSSTAGSYTTLTFTSTTECTWTAPNGVVNFDVLVVGAGGGGGSDAGGGGGGGAFYQNNVTVTSGTSTSFNIVAGAGGRPAIHTADGTNFSGLAAGPGAAGTYSRITSTDLALNLTANGGLVGGGSSDVTPGVAGTGGAMFVSTTSAYSLGTATTGQGGTGGTGIAFGVNSQTGVNCGASAGIAGNPGSGGVGNLSIFSGAFAGGGGGGACLNSSNNAYNASRYGGAGANGGGNGAGGYNDPYVRFHPTNSVANSGAGGGAGASHGSTAYYTDPIGKSGYTRNGAYGANGVVKVRYKIAPTSVSTITNPSDVFAASGTSPTVTASATDPGGGTIKIQWQVSTNSGSSWSNVGSLNTGTSNTFTVSSVTTSQNGYQYRALIRNYDAGGNYSETASSAATLRVSASTLSSISFSPSTVTTGTSTSYLVNGSATVQQTFYGCYSDRTNATKNPQPGSTTWTGLSSYSRTNSGTTPETLVRELWFNRDSSGNAVNSAPTAADCTRIAGAYSPDISATLVTNPTASLTSTASAFTPPVGASFSTSLTSSGIGSSVSYSVSPSLPAGLSLSTSTGVISGTPTTVQAAISYTVTATGSTYGSATRAFTIEVTKGTQTVSFTSSVPSMPLPNGTYTPTATSSIGQSVTFSVSSSNGNVCSISGGVVTFQESGDCVVTATQAGTSSYLSATATQTITVGKLSQTVSFNSVAAKTFGDADFSVTATTTAGALAMVYVSTDTAKCTVSGSTVHIVEAGNCVITATQNGTAVYLSASQSLTIPVAKASQATVSVSNASTVVYGSPLTLTATGGSGTSTTFTFSTSSSTCSISGTALTTLSAGSCVITATRAGDVNYNTSASSANFTVTITPKPLTLAVTVSPSSRAYNTTRDVTLQATTVADLSGLINGDGSNISVDNTKLSATVSTADVASNKAVDVVVASGYLTGTKAGNYQLPTISGSPVITITQATQASITFSSSLTTIFTQNITLAAAGGSGTGALTFATTSGACQIASSIMTPVSAGTCVVVATRAADTNYTAQTASQTISIGYADQAVVSMTGATTVEYGTDLTLGAQGGSGTGAYEFAATGNCTISGAVITTTSVGSCVVKARRAGDSGYNVSAWSADVTITITPKPLTVVVTPFPSSREYNGSRAVILATLSSANVTGLVGNDSITLDNSKISATVADATVGVNKPVTTVITTGFLGGPNAANYQQPTVSNSPVLTITQKTQSAVSINSVNTVVYGSSLSLTAQGGDGTGSYEFEVVPDIALTTQNCSISGSTLTTNAVGNCEIRSRKAADTNHSVSAWSTSQIISITRKPLTLAVTVSPSSRAYDTTRAVTLANTTAADLTGIINSDVVTVDNTKLSATVASAIVGDNKVVTVTVASGYLTGANAGNYQLPTVSGSPTVNIVKADQSTVSMTSGNTVVYGNTLTLTASGGDGLMGYEYDVVSGPCTVSAATLSTTAAGTCVVRGRHLGDSNYNVSAWSTSQSVSVTAKPLTLAVTVSPTSRPYNTSTVVGLAATSASNLTGIINGDTVTTDDTKLSAAVTTADVATNKAVTVTVTSGYLTGTHAGNYLLPTVTGTPVLTVTQTSQAGLSWRSVLSTVFGQNITLSATGGSGTGALSFATTSGPCTVASSIVTPTSVGTCLVVVTRAGDTNYTAQTLSGNVSIGQATQSTVSMTNATTVVYGSTLTLTATGGDGTGAFDFAKVNGNCAVSGDVLTPLGVGDCVVHARKLTSTNFLTSAWSADLTVSMTAKPLTLTVSPQNRQWNGSTSVALAATSAADLSGIESGDTVTVNDTFLTATVATADVGTNKTVTVAVASGYLEGAEAGNYLLPTIAGSPTVTISRATQSALSFTSGTTTTFGQTLALSVSGGTGTGSTSYAVDSGPCSVTGSTLSSTAAGSCDITATKAQDANYSAVSVTYTVAVAFADQASVSVTNATTVVYGSTLALSASGGTGTGAYQFATVSGPCSISGTTLSTIAAGSCVLHGRKLGDSGYNDSAWSTNVTVSITPKPVSLAVVVDPSSREYNTSRTVALAATTAANLTGIINNDVVSTDDSKLSAIVSTADVATNKVVTVTVASGFLTGANAGNYQLPTVSGTPVLSITRTAQAAITVTSALTTVFGQNISLSATGGSGTGALTFATTSGPCIVASSIMTPTSAGSCVVVATRAGDTNYFAQTQSATVAIAAATQATVALTSATTVVYGSTLTLTAAGGTGSGAYNFAKVSGACDVTGTTLTPLSAGECVVHVRKAADASYAVSAWSADVTITLTPKPLTLSVSASPGLRQYNGSSVVALATTTSAALIGLEAGDDVSVDHSKLVATVTSPSVGANKPVSVSVQTGYLVGPDAGNYLLPTITGTTYLTITQTNQAGISFANASSVPFGQSLNLVASGGSGTGALTIVQTSGPCTVANNVMTSTGVGTCAVTAIRAADATYLDESTTANITITRAAQTLNFTSSVPSEPMPGDSYTPVAVSSGGTAVSLNITRGLVTVCTLSNGVVSFVAAGQCEITASQAGTSNYLPATSVSQTIVAGMLNQTISFPIISDRDFGSAAFSAGASVNSPLTLIYSTTTGSLCGVNSSGLITPLAVGTCSVTISQPTGNDVYAAASPVTRTFRILAIVPTAPQVTSVSSGDSSITVAFTPPASRGGVPITNYVLTATPTSGPAVIKSDCAAVPVSTPPACTISGLTNGENYTLTVAATNSAGTGPASNSTPSISPATTPDSVTSLAAVPGNTTLTATWRPPTNFGGGTFSRYEVTLTPRGGTPLPTVMLFSSAANRYAFTGLTNGVAYDLEVLVISTANTTDMGSNRATAIGIPATEASAPRNVMALATSSTTAVISWEVPTSNGGAPITGYSVSPAGCVFATPTATRCEYQNLTPRSTFTVSVVATNVMGGSEAADTSLTMPDTPAPPVITTRVATPAPAPEPIVTPAVISSIPEFKNAPYPGIGFDAPKTGNVIALVDGDQVDAWMSVTGQTITVQTEQGVKVSVQNTDSSSTSGSSLVLNPGSTVAVQADGYTPGSPLEAWIFSTPVRLGAGVADENGSFKGEFPLSSSAQLGQHTVVLHGLSTSGEVITVAIGVKVIETTQAVAEKKSDSSTGVIMGYVLLGLLLMTALVLMVNRRRSKNEG